MKHHDPIRHRIINAWRVRRVGWKAAENGISRSRQFFNEVHASQRFAAKRCREIGFVLANTHKANRLREVEA
jgi:hypothetical protein